MKMIYDIYFFQLKPTRFTKITIHLVCAMSWILSHMFSLLSLHTHKNTICMGRLVICMQCTTLQGLSVFHLNYSIHQGANCCRKNLNQIFKNEEIQLLYILSYFEIS